MHVFAPSPGLVATVPVVYCVFEVLRPGEQLTIGLSYRERRALLDYLDLAGDTVRGPSVFTDRDDRSVLAMA